MKLKFPEQFRPSIDDFTKLWSDCIFAVDANVLLNLYRYSSETRTLLENTLNNVKDRLFIPNQAAKEFLKNRLIVTAGQADEYTKAIKTINDLSLMLSNKKKHPFLSEAELPLFSEQVNKVVEQLENQKSTLLERLTNDEILEFVANIFDLSTGDPYSEDEMKTLVFEGESRYSNEIPPGYKDGKKDPSGDPYRKFGDLIVWKQIIDEAKKQSKPVIFITDDKKEDWWLEQSGRTISPRTELRGEFISFVDKDFWMYTVDKFIEESAKLRDVKISDQVIAEIIEVSNEANEQRRFAYNLPLKTITKELMLEKLVESEKWAAQNHMEFIGLASLVKNYLGNMGYDYSTSYDVIRQLEDSKLVEVYLHHDDDFERPVKAIRIPGKDSFRNQPLENLKKMMEQDN